MLESDSWRSSQGTITIRCVVFDAPDYLQLCSDTYTCLESRLLPICINWCCKPFRWFHSNQSIYLYQYLSVSDVFVKQSNSCLDKMSVCWLCIWFSIAFETSRTDQYEPAQDAYLLLCRLCTMGGVSRLNPFDVFWTGKQAPYIKYIPNASIYRNMSNLIILFILCISCLHTSPFPCSWDLLGVSSRAYKPLTWPAPW